jgi:hypothetical protein
VSVPATTPRLYVYTDERDRRRPFVVGLVERLPSGATRSTVERFLNETERDNYVARCREKGAKLNG